MVVIADQGFEFVIAEESRILPAVRASCCPGCKPLVQLALFKILITHAASHGEGHHFQGNGANHVRRNLPRVPATFRHVLADAGHNLLGLERELAGGRQDQRLAVAAAEVEALEGRDDKGDGLAGPGR